MAGMTLPCALVLSKVEVTLVRARLVEVAFAKMVLPATVKVPFALRAPPTFNIEESVVEDVTASVPVLVAPVVVRPPLKAICVVVALLENGYPKFA